MPSSEKFYITTTLPYVNAAPHIGFALEIVLADIIARYQGDVLGKDVFFNTGTDEHGLKIHRRAEEEGVETQVYTDRYAELFKKMMSAEEGLNIGYTNFIRTTDAHHKAAAQEFWKRCEAKGDIYLKAYQTKYCVGCELEKTDSELVDGVCPLHPNTPIELIDEENYFFRFSKYQQALLNLYAARPEFVVPASRLHEIRTFVEGGLEDFSISRLKTKMPWGVAVPGNEEQVMYVWFDALVNYVSTLGWPEDADMVEGFWGTAASPVAVQIAGKDNLRQQSAMWQAMLLSAGMPTSKQILIHGFITSGGVKMSKSIGNVIDPLEVRAKYGTDALRYFLAKEIPTYEDGDFTWERFADAYRSGLVNGLGNLVSRTLKMATSYGVTADLVLEDVPALAPFVAAYHEAMGKHQVKIGAEAIWGAIADTNAFIETTEPFKKIKVDEAGAKRDVAECLRRLATINAMLVPFLPETSGKITAALVAMDGSAIPKLFPRMEEKAL